MWKLLIGLALLATVAGAAALVPLHGRTLWDRWNASRGPGDFLERGYHEAKAAAGMERPHPGRGTRPARPTKSQARQSRPATPTERHSDSDRAALDRIIAEHGNR